jgi:hypothetical protein
LSIQNSKRSRKRFAPPGMGVCVLHLVKVSD